MCPLRNLECSLLVTGRSDEFYKDKCKDVRIKVLEAGVQAELKVEAQAGRMEVLKSSNTPKPHRRSVGSKDKRPDSTDFSEVGQERKTYYMTRMKERGNDKFQEGDWVNGNNIK